MPERRRIRTLEEVNPPLDTLSPHSPESLLPVLAPDAVHDLRGHKIDELQYPAMTALVVAGIPGAGKSTVLRRFFGATTESEDPSCGPAGSVVLDSLQARNRWRHRLDWLPYTLWRPVVHVAHFAGIRAALRDTDGPVVIHDCATFGWARRMISRWAAEYGRELHVVLVDVPAVVARAGQHARGRRSNRMTFTLHCFRWQRLMERLAAGGNLRPAPASLVIVDRSNVNQLSRITFAA